MSRKEYYDPVVQKSTSYNPYIAGPCVTLTEPIDVALLSEVIEELRVRFPYFYGKAKIEDDNIVVVPNPLPVVVRDSWEPINLFSEEANYHFMSVKVDGNRFAIEFSHALSDGTGFLSFFKSILFCYLTRKTGEKFDPTGFHLPGEEIPESETGNPFAGFDLDSVELSVPNTLSPDQIYRFSEEKIGERKHNNVVFMEMPESTVMDYWLFRPGELRPTLMFLLRDSFLPFRRTLMLPEPRRERVSRLEMALFQIIQLILVENFMFIQAGRQTALQSIPPVFYVSHSGEQPLRSSLLPVHA